MKDEEQPVKLKPWTENIDPKTIPDEVLYSERGRRNNALRKVHSGGKDGRPPDTSRCPCGEMTRDRAQKRNHKCGFPRCVDCGTAVRGGDRMSEKPRCFRCQEANSPRVREPEAVEA
jgi:hypothetical protein